MVRLGIVSEEVLFREGLSALFAAAPDTEVHVLVADVPASIRDPNAESLHLLLVDAGLLSGPKALAQLSRENAVVESLRAALPRVAIVMLDDSPREHQIRQALRWRLEGYVTKQDAFSDLLNTVRGIARGERKILAPMQFLAEFGENERPPQSNPSLRRLTSRELEVLTCLAGGLSVQACSEALSVTRNTVVNHKANIMKKLGVHRTTELLRVAIREGLVQV